MDGIEVLANVGMVALKPEDQGLQSSSASKLEFQDDDSVFD